MVAFFYFLTDIIPIEFFAIFFFFFPQIFLSGHRLILNYKTRFMTWLLDRISLYTWEEWHGQFQQLKCIQFMSNPSPLHTQIQKIFDMVTYICFPNWIMGGKKNNSSQIKVLRIYKKHELFWQKNFSANYWGDDMFPFPPKVSFAG